MRAWTDLSQSRRLAEILPHDTADGTWARTAIAGASLEVPEELQYMHSGIPFKFYSGIGIPSWSLAALMNVFPKEEGSCTSLSFGYYDVEGNYTSSWLCCYEKEGESTDDYIIETIPADNPVDACVNMIIWLKEQNLL